MWMLTLLLACGGAGECAATTQSACEGDDACVWYEPGCAPPESVIEAGCYPSASCREEGCDAGLVCAARMYDPCAGSDCDACGAPAEVCVPE